MVEMVPEDHLAPMTRCFTHGSANALMACLEDMSG